MGTRHPDSSRRRVTPGYHIVFFLDPATLLPTALFTFQATDDHFMHFHFAAEEGFSWASESAAYLGGPYATAMADGTLQDISALINSGPLQVNMQVSTVHVSSVPDSGATAPLLSLSFNTYRTVQSTARLSESAKPTAHRVRWPACPARNRPHSTQHPRPFRACEYISQLCKGAWLRRSALSTNNSQQSVHSWV